MSGPRAGLAWLAGALAACALALPAVPASAADGPLQGRPLVEVIEALDAAGLEVYYSSDLVQPWMTVQEEPRSADPAALLGEILAPFGLATRPGPDGGVLVVRRPPAAPPPTGTVLGVVRHAGTGRRVAGLPVRLEGRAEPVFTSPRGQFTFGDVPPGTYGLEIGRGQDTLAARATVTVEAGRVAIVRVPVEAEAAHQLEAVVVSASRYDLPRGVTGSLRFLPVEDIEVLPDLGDDPLRAVARLPGTASGRLSARTHLRGGETDETLIRFDGLRLRNPFHLKDFQGIFSAIDPAVVRGLDVYTGGVPAHYGDRMSGVVDIRSIEAPPAPYHEVAGSFFNTSALTAGSVDEGRAEWVAAARRGNLDLVVNASKPELGDPRYTDAYGRLGVQLSDALRVTGNVLVFDDDLRLSDSDAEENARAAYRDRYYWLRFDHGAAGLAGTTLLAHTGLEWNRHGTIEREGVSTGRLAEERAFSIDSLQSDWSLPLSPRWRLDFGAVFARQRGHYNYEDEAEFDVLFGTPGAATDPARATDLHVDPSGEFYGAYVNARARLGRRLVADAGLRWDRQTLSADAEEVLSPRLGLLVRLGEHTALRASLGRHYQFQGIEELQVSDGLTDYAPAQRADHAVAGLEHRTPGGTEFRLEAYVKDMDRLRPRYENLLNTKVLLPELQPDRVRIAPSGARARGVEVGVAQRGDGPLSWWLAYTWSRVEDEVPEGDVRRAWDQEDSVQGGLEWRRGPWTVALAAAWSTGFPTTGGEIGATEPIPVVETGPRNGLRMGDYFSLDARVSREWRWQTGALTAFVEVTNLTSRFNQCCVDYDIEDEDGEVSLDMDPDNYLEVFPSLGFTWRFGPGADSVP